MSTNFVARQKGSFTSLIQSTSLGPYGLEARPPVTLRDRYFDTDDGELLRRGMRLLVRDVDGELTAYLIGIEDAESSPKWVGSLLQESLEPDHRVLTSAFELPRGDLQDALLEYIEGDHVAPLLELRQHQTRRIVREGDREVAILSFDVVVFEDPVEPVISNEAVLKVSDVGTTEDADAIVEIFREVGLEPEERSKFDRGVLRKARTMDEPILLLPSEREELERIASEGAEMERKSARVILMDSRDFRDMTIADETGFKTPTVRRLRHAFRQSRMNLFEYLLEEEPSASLEEMALFVDVGEEGEEDISLADQSTRSQDDAETADEGQSFEDIDSLLEAFRPVETHTPRFREPVEDETGSEEASEDVGSDDQKSVSQVAAARLREELDRLDHFALAARASKTDLEAVGGILYTAHRFLVLLAWFSPLVPRGDFEALAPPLEDAIRRADGVLDYCGAAESRSTGELLEQRDRAVEAFHDWLRGDESAKWRGWASRLILRLENQHRPDEPRPSSEKLLASALTEHYQKMCAYAEKLDGHESDPSELYRLASFASGLQLLVEEAGRNQKTELLLHHLSKVETTLAQARHARIRAALTGESSFLDRGPDIESIQASLGILGGDELRESLESVVTMI